MTCYLLAKPYEGIDNVESDLSMYNVIPPTLHAATCPDGENGDTLPRQIPTG
jgi:hypothetical protein